MGTDKRARQKANRAKKIAEVQKVEKRDQRKQYVIVIALLVVGVAAAALLLSLTGGDDDDTATTSTTSADTADSGGSGDSVPAATANTTPVNDVPAVSAPAPGASSTGTPECPAEDGSAERTTSFGEAPPTCIDDTKTYTATMETTLGPITAELDPAVAPATVNNFVFLARYHYYDGVPFHRIIQGFVIQGGDAVGDPLGTGGPGYTIAEELPQVEGDAKAYEVGSLAMANTGQSNSTGSQFFVVTGENGVNLPPQYSLFGKVTGGMDVVSAIESLPTNVEDYPTQEIYITKVTIAES